MSKRSGEELTELPPSKRLRAGKADSTDRLSSLSDEILLHILSFLPIPSLAVCQRLSRRFHALAGDSELWKRKYYSRWVWPRACRLAHFKWPSLPQQSIDYSPKVSKWLGHSHLAEEGKVTDWKKQYRLRHNWSKGICRVSEVEVAQPPLPPMLVKLYAGIVFTADADCGLRAWSTKHPKSCLASASFHDPQRKISSAVPTALTAGQGYSQRYIEITVGFEDGYIRVYDLDVEVSRVVLRFSHATSSNGAITAIASSSPYLLMISQHKVLSLYEIHPTTADVETVAMRDSPRLITSLKADNILAPMSLSIRNTASEIIASIAYSFCHIGCGWCLGIQELRLSRDGEHLGSRLTTTVDSQYGKSEMQLPMQSRRARRHRNTIGSSADQRVRTVPSEPSILHSEPPTSLSYSHPYLLTSHADNTLTMYLVVSTSDTLLIRGGRRLWGHTSSVSGVQVSDRGKAVSVSSRGNEIRIWELETVVSSPSSSRRALQGENSVQISPENKLRRKSVSEPIDRGTSGLGRALEDMSSELEHNFSNVMTSHNGYFYSRQIDYRHEASKAFFAVARPAPPSLAANARSERCESEGHNAGFPATKHSNSRLFLRSRSDFCTPSTSHYLSSTSPLLARVSAHQSVSRPLRSSPISTNLHRNLSSTVPTQFKMDFQTGGRGCFNCGDASHQARDCPKKGTPTCYNCGGQGHVSRECTVAPKEKSCYRCGQSGHISRECPQAGSGDNYGGSGGQECYKCGQVGHIARNCSQGGGFGNGYGGSYGAGFGGRQQTCYSCGGYGHMARDCTQGQKCYNCGEVGHVSRDCPTEANGERVCYKCKQPGHVQAACPN
ncbi:hypothetical protein VTN00DRAFT_8592 [Thermoascus crustaceus]|uniref:uncharacterized protein n=1 Tax=Thermoascus crustaceus TaxID=5088 RepID=UPI0037438F0C